LLVDQDTPPETIEACYRGGAENCILRPVRLNHITTHARAIQEQRSLSRAHTSPPV